MTLLADGLTNGGSDRFINTQIPFDVSPTRNATPSVATSGGQKVINKVGTVSSTVKVGTPSGVGAKKIEMSGIVFFIFVLLLGLVLIYFLLKNR